MVTMTLVIVLECGCAQTKGRANGPTEIRAKTMKEVAKYHFVFGR